MTTGKGHCKHGEFDIMKGCPDCIQEERERREAKDLGEEVPVEEQAGPGGPGANTCGAKPEPAADEPMPPRGLAEAAQEAGAEIKVVDLAPEQEELAPETALARSPGADVEVMSYYNEARKLQEYAEKRVIIGPETAKEATDDLSIISRLKKAMEEKKREYLDPLRTKAEAIRETYTTLMDPVFRADKVTREKLIAYQKEQECKRLEQEEVNRLRMEAAQKEAALSGTGEISESVGLIEVAPEVKNVRTNLGTAGMVANWKYEIVDILAIPREYLVIDGAMLNAIAKKHHDQKPIPGVRFYNDPTLAVRAR